MKIFFLDDSSGRRDKFRQNTIGHTVDFAINGKEAISLLQNNEYDMIFLDHDLEDEHYQSNEDHHEDGRWVARHLNEMAKHHNKIVIVHSLNENGREAIFSILKERFQAWKAPMAWTVPLSELLTMIGYSKGSSEVD